jgi:hypothetical protein
LARRVRVAVRESAREEADSQGRQQSERRDEAGESTMKKSTDNLGPGSADTDDRFGEPLTGEPLATFRGTVRREVLGGGDLHADNDRRNGSMSAFDGLPGLPPPPSVLDVPGPHIPVPPDGRVPDGRIGDGRLSDSRLGESRLGDGRLSDSRLGDSRLPESRLSDMPLPEMSRLDESVFDPPSWLDNPTMPLADHPLLRGLLLELPAKGPMPTADWLDRWFEAARSILELLYAQSSR